MFFLVLHGQMLTRSVLAWQLTGNEMSLAWINLAFALPMIFLAFPGGVLNDRISRLKLTRFCQIALTLNESAVFILLVTDQLEYWHVVIAAATAGCLFPIVLPSRTAIVYNLVGNQALGSATAVSSTILNVSRVMGPALFGWVIAGYTVTHAYALAAFLFLISWTMLLPIPTALVPSSTINEPKSMRLDIIEGIHYIRTNRPIMISLMFAFLPLIILIPLQNLMVLFAEQVWQVSEQGLGIMMAISGLGGVLGSIWIMSRGENTARIRAMVLSMVAFALLTAFFSLSGNYLLALVLLLAASFGAASASTLNNTSIQLLTNDENRGRVSAITMGVLGFAPLTVAPIAWLAQNFGVSIAFASFSFLITLLTLLFYFCSRTLRDMDTHVETAIARESQKA